MSTLIPVLITFLMSAVAVVVVLVREGQFQQLSALLEARHTEMGVLKKDVALATANALSALQRVSETQARLEAAENESLDLREKLGAVTFQLGQERLKREAADEATREFKARAHDLEQRCHGLEKQCLELTARGQDSEARAVAAEARAAELQQRVTALLQELHQLRCATQDGAEVAARTAAAAAQVAQVERAIHAQTEQLLTALAVLRHEAEGFLRADTPVAETEPDTALELALHDNSTEQPAPASPLETETVRSLVPHALARLTWAQPEQVSERHMEAIAS